MWTMRLLGWPQISKWHLSALLSSSRTISPSLPNPRMFWVLSNSVRLHFGLSLSSQLTLWHFFITRSLLGTHARLGHRKPKDLTCVLCNSKPANASTAVDLNAHYSEVHGKDSVKSFASFFAEINFDASAFFPSSGEWTKLYLLRMGINSCSLKMHQQ